ncbi:AGE family epimerase/isomerase [Microbulbifer zhoushanensis]|uniref:AGE family epimerase/isomerase n=1 Tax=Microbulbifer zhoushanensis TaxID=2904254 RepID=UPI001F3CA359|nr:AGE family epimerase/isomerase [Microbulbifer zhoushanensis]
MERQMDTRMESLEAVAPEAQRTQQDALTKLIPEFNHQLKDIARWWRDHSLDEAHGGFLGEVSVYNIPHTQADKGVVLNARILWFFSELGLHRRAQGESDVEAIALAQRAFDYFVQYFDDAEYGGAFWSLDYRGQVREAKKQTYAQAFCIYGFASFYRLTGNTQALDKAQAYFRKIEAHCVDRSLGGYVEAVAHDWSPVSDFRLSEKDLNAPKTMNNHLHVLEAYTGLYRALPTEEVATALRASIEWFCEYIVNEENGHLRLFLDMEWRDVSGGYSYGHDIEGSWLLEEALEVLGDHGLEARYMPLVRALGESCLREGIGERGQVLDHFDFKTHARQLDSEWWVQAEALVGFLNMWEVTGSDDYARAFNAVWKYVKSFQIDHDDGEWLYHASLYRASKGDQRYKLGFWKGPYHNGRAMMEVSQRLARLVQQESDEKIQEEAVRETVA